MVTNEAFLDFLHAEMRRRDFTSARQFAAWLGVSNSMLAHVLNGTRDPGLEFLAAISNKTGVNIADLIELAKPGTLTRTDLTLSDRILAQQIAELSEDDKAFVRRVIRGMGERTNDTKHRN